MNKKHNLNNVKTFGCRLNALESDVIQKHINKHNLDNIHVVNTCSVTNESERQAKQFIRKLSKVSPEDMRGLFPWACQTPDTMSCEISICHPKRNPEKAS